MKIPINKKAILTSILLVFLAILGFLVRIPIFSYFSLYLGPLFLLLLKPVFGKKLSLLISIATLGFLWFIEPGQSELLLKIVEISFLLLINKNTRIRKSFLLWDFIFWILCITLLHQFYIQEGLIKSFSEANLFYILLACNGFLNTALADFLIYNPIGVKYLGYQEPIHQFHLEDLVFQTTMIILSFSFVVYLSLAITHFEKSITESAKNNMYSHYESILFNFQQIPKQYKLYADLGKKSGTYYIKNTIDSYSFPEGSVHITLADGSIYPPIYQETPLQLANVSNHLFRLSEVQEQYGLNNILRATTESYLYADTSEYGRILILLPFQYFFNNAYYLYFGQLPYLVLLMIIGLFLIRLVIHRIFRSYHQLITLTSNLPERIQSRHSIMWPNYKIYEFSVLVKHFQEMTNQLTDLFDESDAINEELSQQALTLIESESRLKEIALMDMLTKLPNRHYFQEFLETLIKKIPTLSFAIVFIDLDRFKQINDTYGHNVGDLLLQKIAERLKAPFKKASSEKHMVARLGGDEFVLLLVYDDLNDLDQLLKSMLSSLNQPMDLEEHRLYCVASFGVALFPLHGDDRDTLIKKADASMYASKASGGNKITYFNQDIRMSYEENLQTEYELHEAFHQNEFKLYYQPILDTEKHHFFSYEGLLRWHHPIKGLLETKEFINEAAQSGVLEELGKYALLQVCEDQKSWSSEGLCRNPVFINLTHYQLESHSLVEQLQDLLEKNMLSPRCIAFDINQETLYENTEIRMSILKQIHVLGFSLCLDNFGRVDTSLSYLQKNLFDFVKISGTLYPCQGANERESALIKSISHYCQQVDIEVIYKDIENEFLYEWINDFSPHYLQGYFIASAMERSEISKIKRKELTLENDKI